MVSPRRLRAPLLAVVFALLANGCWDRVEINNRGFVAGVSIDTLPAEDGTEERAKSAAPYRICYQIVVPGGQSGDGESSKGSTGYSNLCGKAASLSAFHQYATDKLSRPPFYDHLKVILVSDQVARKGTGFADMLDFFMRGAGVRRSIKILVAKGNASEALNSESPNEGLPASDIEKISGNRSSLEKLPATQIGFIHERFMNETSYAVQSLETSDKSVLVSGSAIFDGKTNRQWGALNPRQTTGLNFLRGYHMRGMITLESAGSSISLNIYEIKSRIRADVRDPEHIRFEATINVVVGIRESSGTIDLVQKTVMDRIQHDAASEIESMIEDAVDALQHDIGKDALGLGEELKQNHPRTWEKVKSDWDQGKMLLSACEVRAHATVGIRLTGTVDQTERG
ncbi:spore germination protein [Cohnella sp. OV330]|uniref:Ger(x)C family spore germination protein n=1 Tax=Cohnella sp. OV330 TaxID=1855288 RepID=UPI0008EC45EF|nr:Ger(x)C family spore germination protein [Cohnella sp. OV330]SFA87860.1 spore germination protein [Cohnella sp. OV330]